MKKVILGAVTLLAVGCASRQPFSPEPNPNPWPDDYSHLTSMADYRSWGTYNVHDPSCKRFGDTYYMYSTDAIYAENRREAGELGIKPGFIQVRRSKDLVSWEFAGWAFPEIPEEAREWVRSNSGGQGATNIWAPYILEHEGRYRLYYSVSAFAQQNSYIGLAESDSPDGPWELVGAVVRTRTGDLMNAIDPSIVTDPRTGRQWMHYGSYFGGLYCVELDPQTGLAMEEGDQGILLASRKNIAKDNVEAPEVIYNPELDKYFLFVSYDPLMTTYGVRMGRSDTPEGPYYDFFGNDMREQTDNFPVLTHPYRFANHPGWAGTGHCAVMRDNDGKYYMFHQGRLSPENHMMVLHVREMKWTADGWPVVSPERYAATQPVDINPAMLPGDWEIIRLRESKHVRGLEAGQILWGENRLHSDEICSSKLYSLSADGKIAGPGPDHNGTWKYGEKGLSLELEGEQIEGLIVFAGQDWENQTTTLLVTGLDSYGRSVWAKKVS